MSSHFQKTIQTNYFHIVRTSWSLIITPRVQFMTSSILSAPRTNICQISRHPMSRLWDSVVHIIISNPQITPHNNHVHLYVTPRYEHMTSHVQHHDILRSNYFRSQHFHNNVMISWRETYDTLCLAHDFSHPNYSRHRAIFQNLIRYCSSIMTPCGYIPCSKYFMSQPFSLTYYSQWLVYDISYHPHSKILLEPCLLMTI